MTTKGFTKEILETKHERWSYLWLFTVSLFANSDLVVLHDVPLNTQTQYFSHPYWEIYNTKNWKYT
jgi:hypothetical protein